MAQNEQYAIHKHSHRHIFSIFSHTQFSTTGLMTEGIFPFLSHIYSKCLNFKLPFIFTTHSAFLLLVTGIPLFLLGFLSFTARCTSV